MSSKWEEMSRHHLHGAMRRLHCALCALLGCSIHVCQNLPKIPKSLHSNSTNPATAFKNFSKQLKSSLYIPLEPSEKLLYPSEFTLKQIFFFLSPKHGQKEQRLPSVHINYIFPLFFLPFPFPPVSNTAAQRRK